MANENSTAFRPVRGTQAQILKTSYNEGYVYYATDTGKIFIDAKGKAKIPMSGNGASVYYSSLSPIEVGNNEYNLDLYSLENGGEKTVLINDMIICADGSFLRVEEINRNKDILTCSQLAISGTGGGGSGTGGGDITGNRIYWGNFKVEQRNNEADILNGSECLFDITANSGYYEDGSLVNKKLTMIVTYTTKGATEPYKKEEFNDVESGVSFVYDATNYLRENAITEIYFSVKGGSADNKIKNSEETITISTHDLDIQWESSQFNNLRYCEDTIKPVVSFSTGVKRIVDIYYDGRLVNSTIFDKTSNTGVIDQFEITAKTEVLDTNGKKTGETLADNFTHGRHTISAQISFCRFDGSRGASSELIEKEVALRLDKEEPLIWFGDIKKSYFEYETPLIPVRVYDPNADLRMSKAYMFADGANIMEDGGYLESDNDKAEYVYFTIKDLYANQNVTYKVRTGEGEHEIYEELPSFTVLEDPRHMGIAESGLKYNIEAKTRTNSESKQRRSIIKIGDKNATLEGFNWYNNGWIRDNDKNTCLRISNGAKLILPIGKMTFAGNAAVTSRTIELRLKIRNVQNYNKIITNFTRYKVVDKPTTPGVNQAWNDDTICIFNPADTGEYVFKNNEYILDQGQYAGEQHYKGISVFQAFLNQRDTGYTSYDAYLTVILEQLRKTNTTIPLYDDLTYNYLYRAYDLSSAMLKYIKNASNPGGAPAICLGPQDGYFSNGTNTVTVDYVENEIINLTIVYDHGTGASVGNDKLMKFYLNGMLTSVARSSVSNMWTIDTDELIIDSSACDIDLYNFRVYDGALGLNKVLQNVAFDNLDSDGWDLATLYKSSTGENSLNEPYIFSYDKMIDYNKNNPSKYLMPYILFTGDETNATDGRLPWKKDIKPLVDMEFVNTGLERAYATGELNTLAKAAGQTVEEYYMHHCPSFVSEGVEMSVQGTSSEFYPRRNYKAKTVNKWVFNQGPFAESYNAGNPTSSKNWYYDNNSVGTDRFTLKIDFMESSGTYNMGLANLLNNAYSHHPLADYSKAKALSIKDASKSAYEVYNGAYDANTTYYYVTHKGAIKPADGNGEAYFKIESAEDFALGPIALFQKQRTGKDAAKWKVLMTDELATQFGATNPTDFSEGKNEIDASKIATYANHWLVGGAGYSATIIADDYLKDLRTTVQGFPTLAFYITKQDAEKGKEPTFIGRYNMLLDKGSSNAYGFSANYYSSFLDNTPMESVAECWEFENNSRGFCSFRDPWNRKELSFAAPETETNAFTTNGAPIVADSFEYRYHVDKDYIDYLYDLNTSAESTTIVPLFKQRYGIDLTVESGRKKMLELYSNWEKAVAWVWSTATDAMIDLDGSGTLVAVPNLGTYEVIRLGAELYVPDKYFIENPDEANRDKTPYVFATGAFDENENYYIKGLDEEKNTAYFGIKLAGDEDHVYKKNTYFTQVNKKNVLAVNDFDASTVYYELKQDTEGLEAWRLPAPVTYGDNTYEYDTKEYRIEKFRNELEDHFNLEYLITYLVVTEVLELYDSRGKNCMMASWGPQTAGGDYIWYPIFYDMDTQLGINNTGIPSFEYNIDATEDGTFSTNDSVLWGNLYSVFGNLISDKYQQLKGTKSETFGGSLTYPPFKSVDTIEGFYSCDPTIGKSLSMTGVRPLLALNLDEQYKYISITNGNVGAMDQNGTIEQVGDTYFYALQGDRSTSRRQFLTNRLNYIDSWLGVGNYKRGGINRIRSRVSANNAENTSDKWIEGNDLMKNGSAVITNEPYFVKDEKGNDTNVKTHLFDGEYWITMTPARNMYVTVGTDAANFPSVKYTGTPIKFETEDLKKGVRQSGNYREQLYYIYGLDQMKSLGDLSRLYFQEFDMTGTISKMTDLKLGYDGVDESNQHYLNKGVNDWTIPASAELKSGGMPLLKEVNLSYIQFKNPAVTFDFTSCEKLENFRNVGSNITQVKFAEGVALDTLHLASTTTSLELIEARKLTNIITDYHVPQADAITGNLVADKGLYIEGLTDGFKRTAITTLDLRGGNLGYHSYNLLKLYYDACINTNAGEDRYINLNDVQWSPYVIIEDPAEVWNKDSQYFVDNGHFGFKPYTNYDYATWVQYINNKQMYIYDESIYLKDAEGNNIDITTTKLLDDLIKNPVFKNTSSVDNEIPNITGYVYINNTDKIDEGVIQKTYSNTYPGLKIFFANVEPGYAARFIIEKNGVQTLVGIDKVGKEDFSNGTKKFFTNPLDRTEASFLPSTIDALESSKDFIGWSTTNNRTGLVESYDKNWVTVLGNTAKHAWKDLAIDEEVTDYTYYAVFEDHHWLISYIQIENDGSETVLTTQSVVDGDIITPPADLYSRDESNLADDKRYRMLGYVNKSLGNSNIVSSANYPLFDFSKKKASGDLKFYAVYYEESVYDTPTDLDYFKFEPCGYADPYDSHYSYGKTDAYRISPKEGVELSGKITLPTEYNGKPIIAVSGFGYIGSMSADNVAQPFVTHIYWYGTPKVVWICDAAFGYCSNLQYFQLPATLREIGERAFTNTTALKLFDFSETPVLAVIGGYAFTKAFNLDNPAVDEFRIPGSVKAMYAYALGNVQFKVDTMIMGSKGTPFNPVVLGDNTVEGIVCYDRGGYAYVNKYLIYTTSGTLDSDVLRNAFEGTREEFMCTTGIVDTVQA